MKKFALSLVLFFASMSVFAAECSKEDFTGKWWYQDGNTLAQVNLSPGGYAMFNLSGTPARTVASFEKGKARIYLGDCRITLYRPDVKKHDDGSFSWKDDDHKIVEQNGILTHTDIGNGVISPSVIIFQGGTMFKKN